VSGTPSGTQPSTYPGTYYDGLSAAGTPVEVDAAPAALIARAGDGAELARWTYLGLRFVDDHQFDDAVRLAHGDDPARLVIHDAAARARIGGRLAGLGGRKSRRRRVLAGVVIAVCAFAGGGLGLWYALPWIAHEVAARLPPAWDEALGRHAKVQFDRAFKVSEGRCAAPAGRAALERLTARLSAAADTPFAFHPVVVDVAKVNAFALPGGTIYVFRGLLEHTGSAEQLAGVLAHEMAHVEHRDGVARLLHQIVIEAVLRLLDRGSVAGFAGGLLGQAYSRDAEAAADREGQRILVAAGIDARGLRDFLVNLKATQHELPGPLALLSSHPLTGERIAALNPPPGGGPAMSAADWAALRAICGEAEKT
jgi:Zn-dependent protease with chaperone function